MNAVQFPRRHFLTSLLAALWRPRGAIAQVQSRPKNSVVPIRVSTLNHVSFGCDDIKSTVQWYGRVFGVAVHAFYEANNVVNPF